MKQSMKRVPLCGTLPSQSFRDFLEKLIEFSKIGTLTFHLSPDRWVGHQ